MQQNNLSRRRFLTTAAAAGASAAGAVTLFTPGTLRPARAAGVTTLTIMSESNELTPAYITQFEHLYPDIKIRFMTANQTTFNSMLAAGKPPDIYRQAAVSSTSYIIQGVYENLQPYLAKSTVLKESDLEPVNNLFRWNGKAQGQGPIYGIVKDWSLDLTLWYNKKALQAAGYAAPGENESLDLNALLPMAEKMTKRKSGQILQYGLDMAWGWSQQYPWLMAMAQAAGSSLFSADLKTANFTSPEVLKALQWFVDYTKAQVGTSPLITDANSPTGPFVAGRTALSTIGYWFGEQIQADPHHLTSYLATAPAPHWANTRISPCIAGIGFSITSASPNKDAAWTFMEYFNTGQPALDRVHGGWGLPSLKHFFPQLPRQTAFDRARYQVTLNDLHYFKPLKITPYADSTAVSNAISTAIVSVVKGNATLPQAAQTLESAVNRLIQQGLQSM